MALSNFRREPRREITEQIVGTLAFAIVFGGAYYCADKFWFGPQYDAGVLGIAEHFLTALLFVAGAFMAGIIVFFLGLFVSHGIHQIGEGTCGLLARVGLDPRPRRRY